MATPRQEHEATELRARALYATYVKPMETQHRGRFVAVSSAGKTIVGDDLLDVAQKAKATFGPGSHLFKVGEVAVGKWR